MSKFNTTATHPVGHGPIHSESKASGTTFEGAEGFARDAKSELFLLAVTNMVGEHTFYESSGARDDRFATLVHAVAADDLDWLEQFGRWLRNDAHMRSASLVLAAEAVKTGAPARKLVDSVLRRADEPSELVAYWHSHHGRALPKALKRGIADAAQRLYTERNAIKYDTESHAIRFADVIRLCHVTPAGDWQSELFRHLIGARIGVSNGVIPDQLELLARNQYLRGWTPDMIHAASDDGTLTGELAAAGVTWEAVPSYVKGAWTRQLWESVIPSMGYMATLRNLKNFDEAGVSDEIAATVADKLADPAEVARSRQFPFRFLAAYETAPSLRWGPALDTALGHCLSNLPSLPGRSLILIDTSASMTRSNTARSKVTAAKAAAVFGVALAAKGENVDLHGFASGTFRHTLPAGASVIREVDRFLQRIGEVGHGTEMEGSLRNTYAGQDRVFIVSDMQTMTSSVSAAVPANVPVYGFNIGGYRNAAMATGPNRHEFGGLTDATFRMVPLLERGQNTGWPWEAPGRE